ncbi:MAG: hypothetical protein Q8930_17990 [Bacillota bacterium]|nr:hypothetical protein [Bacillota bacterium]
MNCSKCGKDIDNSAGVCIDCGNALLTGENFAYNIDDTIISFHEDIKKPESPALTNLKGWMRKRRKIIITSVLGVSILLCVIFAGIESLKAFGSKNSINSVDFVLMIKTMKKDDEYGDLYQSLTGKEKLKLAADVLKDQSFPYIYDNLHGIRYLCISKDSSLCEINQSGIRSEICSNTMPFSMVTSSDHKNYLFTTAVNVNELYVKFSGKEKKKIASGGHNYYFLPDNETYVYTDSANTMFMGGPDKPAEELAKNVSICFSFSPQNVLIYADMNNELYYMDIKSMEIKELGPFNWWAPVFDKESGMWYLNNTDLYYMNIYDGKTEKVAENIRQFGFDRDMITYLDNENNVYCKLNKDSEAIKLPEASQAYEAFNMGSFVIYEDRNNKLFKLDIKSGAREQIYHMVETLWKKDEQIYFKSPSGFLFVVDKSGKTRKIAEGVTKANITADSDISYLTAENKLYLKDRIIKDVKDYFPSGNNVLYRNSKGELYIVTGKSEPRKVCDNVEDYAAIYFGDPTGYYLQNILLH